MSNPYLTLDKDCPNYSHHLYLTIRPFASSRFLKILNDQKFPNYPKIRGISPLYNLPRFLWNFIIVFSVTKI